jgi:hypothetical protein
LFKFLEQLSTILYLKYIFLQKELVKSLEDVGSGPIGRGPFVMKGEEEKNNEERNKEEEEALSRARESHLVVAALIATVTFAAAFTLPGGYKSDQGPNEGTAILAKKSCFYSICYIRCNVNGALSFSCLYPFYDFADSWF